MIWLERQALKLGYILTEILLKWLHNLLWIVYQQLCSKERIRYMTCKIVWITLLQYNCDQASFTNMTHTIASLPDVIISITTHPTIVRTFSGGILWSCPSQLGQVVVHLGDGKTSWQPCHPRQSVPEHLLPMFCPAWVNVCILQFIIRLNSSILCFNRSHVLYVVGHFITIVG